MTSHASLGILELYILYLYLNNSPANNGDERGKRKKGDCGGGGGVKEVIDVQRGYATRKTKRKRE